MFLKKTRKSYYCHDYFSQKYQKMYRKNHWSTIICLLLFFTFHEKNDHESRLIWLPIFFKKCTKITLLSWLFCSKKSQLCQKKIKKVMRLGANTHQKSYFLICFSKSPYYDDHFIRKKTMRAAVIWQKICTMKILM